MQCLSLECPSFALEGGVEVWSRISIFKIVSIDLHHYYKIDTPLAKPCTPFPKTQIPLILLRGPLSLGSCVIRCKLLIHWLLSKWLTYCYSTINPSLSFFLQFAIVAVPNRARHLCNPIKIPAALFINNNEDDGKQHKLLNVPV